MPETTDIPERYASPEVSIEPSAVVALPTPSPPDTYRSESSPALLPPIERSPSPVSAGVVVPVPRSSVGVVKRTTVPSSVQPPAEESVTAPQITPPPASVVRAFVPEQLVIPGMTTFLESAPVT